MKNIPPLSLNPIGSHLGKQAYLTCYKLMMMTGKLSEIDDRNLRSGLAGWDFGDE